MGPINFENAKKEREKAVIARLIDIRKAQQEYRSLHRGMYAPKLDIQLRPLELPAESALFSEDVLQEV